MMFWVAREAERNKQDYIELETRNGQRRHLQLHKFSCLVIFLCLISGSLKRHTVCAWYWDFSVAI